MENARERTKLDVVYRSLTGGKETAFFLSTNLKNATGFHFEIGYAISV
jgi:hypothetical protein